MDIDYKSLPPLPGLLTFHAVARAQSFSAAARQLHVTQGAVSHRIRALEESLGVPLFLRMPRQVKLTEPGMVLFAAVQDAFLRLSAGVHQIEDQADGKRVGVSCSPSFAIRWLVPHLGQLRLDHPDIDVHVAADDRLVEPGSSGVDLCVRFGPGGYLGVDAVRLTDEDVFAVCSPLYLEKMKLRRLHQLSRCDLLHADALADHEAHVGWSEWLRAVGADGVDPDQGVHLSHAHMALEAATAGQGVALGRNTLTDDAIASGQLVRLFGSHTRCGFAYWLLAPRGGNPRPAVRDLRGWLLSEFACDECA